MKKLSTYLFILGGLMVLPMLVFAYSAVLFNQTVTELQVNSGMGLMLTGIFMIAAAAIVKVEE